MVGRLLLLVATCVLLASCGGGGSAAPTAAGASAAGTAGAGADPSGSGPSTAAEPPITSQGPSGWDRGPYDLAGGSYLLDWESDGSCSALYFGIVGVSNGFKESPPTAGDVALKDMLRGSRVIQNVPAGRHYFNVSNVACRKYRATLTRQ